MSRAVRYISFHFVGAFPCAPAADRYAQRVYAIALSVAACLRARTRVDVAWVVDAQGLPPLARSDALAITPGGGRIGSLCSGAIDGQLFDLAGRRSATGRLVDIEVSTVDALVAGLPDGGRVRCVLTPASELPEALWQHLIARDPVCLVSQLDGDTITDTTLYTSATIDAADDDVALRFRRGASDTVVEGRKMVTVLWPSTRILIVGAGPTADSLAGAAALLGWQPVVTTEAGTATGIVAGMSAMDMVVVMGHDLETVGAVLAAALSSEVGYIGALGSPQMQQTRADWLAYRGITDLDRIHGPAGLNIGASTPAEIAIAIVAQAVAVRNL